MTDAEVNRITDDARRYLSSLCANKVGFVLIVATNGPGVMTINSNVMPEHVPRLLHSALELSEGEPGEVCTEYAN